MKHEHSVTLYGPIDRAQLKEWADLLDHLDEHCDGGEDCPNNSVVKVSGPGCEEPVDLLDYLNERLAANGVECRITAPALSFALWFNRLTEGEEAPPC